MEETKKETKVEFDLEDEVAKSKVLKEYPVLAKFVVERGKYESYSLKLVAKIDGFNVPHVRDERLSERNNQFLIKYLQNKHSQGNDTYKGVFQLRENNETKKNFYCWVVTFEDGYSLPLLVKFDELKFLESVYFKNNKAVK